MFHFVVKFELKILKVGSQGVHDCEGRSAVGAKHLPANQWLV